MTEFFDILSKIFKISNEVLKISNWDFDQNIIYFHWNLWDLWDFNRNSKDFNRNLWDFDRNLWYFDRNLKILADLLEWLTEIYEFGRKSLRSRPILFTFRLLFFYVEKNVRDFNRNNRDFDQILWPPSLFFGCKNQNKGILCDFPENKKI